jgi:hypothetical protein
MPIKVGCFIERAEDWRTLPHVPPLLHIATRVVFGKDAGRRERRHALGIVPGLPGVSGNNLVTKALSGGSNISPFYPFRYM